MGVHVSGRFSFGLAPSLGIESVKELAREFADLLFDAGFTSVVPFRSYEELEHSLLDGEVDAAWGPPIVCARIEANGGSVPFRAVRDGTTSYRSVLLCRQNDTIEIAALGRPGSAKPRAVWVDEWSMGGYILPRHHLARAGVELEGAFAEERLAGSYEECFNAVLDGDADLTASWDGPRGAGYVEICGNSASLFRTLGYTEASPNDALVVAPQLDRSRKDELEGGFRQLIHTPRSLEVLAAMFDVDGFDEPPAGSYGPLLELVRQ
jgi:ABC-type phosphate/phosphonate transport system substrate-binding protein